MTKVMAGVRTEDVAEAEGPVIRIGSRESRLAVRQAEIVRDIICRNHPEVRIEIITMKTEGDRILDRSLAQIGGKGLFVKELDLALADGRIDLAVHSLKDMPMEENEEFPILAYSRREDPRDVLVYRPGLASLPENPVIGTSSGRRKLQMKLLYEGCDFRGIRGNVQTRLRKLSEEGYDATLLAAAGLKRAGMEHVIGRYFSAEEMIPAAGQGILAVQGRAGDERLASLVACVDDRDSRVCALAERAFIRASGGGCTSPMAAHAVVNGSEITLSGLYCQEENGLYKKGKICGRVCDAKRLGEQLAEQLGEQLEEQLGEQLAERSGVQANAGKVWLAGAGPGDAGLLTMKAAGLIRRADVIVYDALISEEILSMIPGETETINVGKQAGNHPVPQEEISEILVREARKGKAVLRLKGGDPFVFGRGGEELEVLVREGIPFEVVPGIPSPVAVPAYAGIPVTHRDYTSSFHVITGHARKDGKLEIDFPSLVKLNGTLVFLMSVSSMGTILNGLLEAGMDADMPAAVLERGTLAGQRRVSATVGTLEKEAEKAGIRTPAIIMAGKVCALSDQLCWAEKRTLGGRAFLVTRPRQRSAELTERLRNLGAQVITLPAVRTEKISPNEKLREALERFGRQAQEEWLVFTSPVGVSVFFEQLREMKTDLRSLFSRSQEIKIAAIGSATAEALAERGLYADVVPGIYCAEELGKAIVRDVSGRTPAIGKNNEISGMERKVHVLAVRAEQGSKELFPPLERAGIETEDVAVYRTRYETHPVLRERIRRMLEGGEIDAAVFTSGSTVRSFAGEMDGLDFSRVQAVCIGEQTAREARRFGMQIQTAREASVAALEEKLTELYGRKDG